MSNGVCKPASVRSLALRLTPRKSANRVSEESTPPATHLLTLAVKMVVGTADDVMRLLLLLHLFLHFHVLFPPDLPLPLSLLRTAICLPPSPLFSASVLCAMHATAPSSYLPFALMRKFGYAIARGCSASVSFPFCRLQLAPHRTTARRGEEVEYLLQSPDLHTRRFCRVFLLLVLLFHMVICLNCLVVTADSWSVASSLATYE
ncbi:hypothetical protein TSMEX_005608 [Taenia solium]|eukprot:TsM_000068600 transcript=TsM_000068600 gene=TsM_000068600